MPVSNSQKTAARKWNADNMKLVATYVRRDQAEEFKKLCQANGDSMHAVLKQAIEDYISEHK